MSKVVGTISLSLVLASAGAAWSQELGIVSAVPSAATGELVVDIPARPDGDKVYVVREGSLVTDATVKSSGGQGGTVITLPAGAAGMVKVGDRISLSSTLEKTLPASAYNVKVTGDVQPLSPGQRQLAQANSAATVRTETTRVTTELGAPEPPPVARMVPPPEHDAAAVVTQQVVQGEQLEKGSRRSYSYTRTTAAIAEPTPRGMGIPLFPAPAVVSTEAGIAAPYGQGLAAAAPVGTPYLRSPAFAGPPIIYMPQTVTRVLLPGATPYPSNIMSPPANYVYASAPFLRTDIYTSLPYGTFYWPQGYAGTTPVEPQVPAYVTAPASAIMSTEADYAAARYVPGVANEETLNPITAGINSNLVASTGLAGDETGNAASISTSVPPVSSLTVLQPGLEATASAETTIYPATEVNPFPVLSDAGVNVSATTPAVVNGDPVMPMLPSAAPLIPTPVLGTPVPAFPVMPAAPVISPTPSAPAAPAPGLLPELPAAPVTSSEVPGLPTLPAVPVAVDAQGLPTLPAASTEIASALPSLPSGLPATATPSSMMPSLPTPAVPAAAANVIIVDDKTPGGITLSPAADWTQSASTTDSYEGGSVMAQVNPAAVKTATFNASIPADGAFEVALWWIGGTPQFRSASVPVTVNTATGPQQTTINQTQSGQWQVLGTYQFKAGQGVPVLTVSTEGVTAPQGANVSVSVDAMRLTPQ